MRQIIVYIFILALFVGCKKVEVPIFSGEDYIQFMGNKEVNEAFSFVYSGSQAKKDTVFIDMQILGPTKPYDRPIRLRQTPEYGFVYIFDEFGIKIDSLLGEKPNQAISGTHFISFDSPDVKDLMVIKADSSTAKLGIVVLRHVTLKENEARLHFRLEPTVDFKLGDFRSVKGLVVISDVLICPDGWNIESGTNSGGPTASRFWGKWGPVKHQFMIDVCKNGERWDSEFCKMINKDESALYEYKRFLPMNY